MPDAHARRVGLSSASAKVFSNPTRLMPPTSSPAPPAGTAPPSRVLLRHPRRRLGYPRAHVGRPIFIECLLSNPTVQVFQRFQGARVRHEKMVKRMSATLIRTRKLAPANAGRWCCKISAFRIFPLASQSRHFPENAPGKYRHCSARALAGLASFADRSTPLPRSANNGGALSLRSDGRKQTRPASDRARPKNTSRMSRGFARHEPAIARDASHGQDTAIGREAPPGQDNRQ